MLGQPATNLIVALSYVATEKIPDRHQLDSLRALLKWARKNPNRVTDAVKPAFDYDFEWFWELRSLRDYLVHNAGVHVNINCDGKQFNLWLHHPTRGWITREPLLPMLAQTRPIERSMSQSSWKTCIPLTTVIGTESHAIHGVTIQKLVRLQIALDYATRSP